MGDAGRPLLGGRTSIRPPAAAEREFEARTTGRGPVSVMAALPDAITAGPIELRRWQPGDLPAVLDAVSASLAELRVWMPWARDPVTAESYADVLENFHATFDAGTEFVFGMFETSGPAVVGGCGLHFRQGPGVGEIGYWVRTDRHRRGFATAASPHHGFLPTSRPHRTDPHHDGHRERPERRRSRTPRLQAPDGGGHRRPGARPHRARPSMDDLPSGLAIARDRSEVTVGRRSRSLLLRVTSTLGDDV